MSDLHFATRPSRLKQALSHASQMTDVSHLQCAPEYLQYLEWLCSDADTAVLITQKELLILLEDCRLHDKPADLVAWYLGERGTPALSRGLYQYWQYYYQDATVTDVCKYYTQKINLSEPWQEEWKKWLNVTDAPLTAARALGKEPPIYRKLRRSYLLQETSAFALRTKALYYRFCSSEEFLHLSDQELCQNLSVLSDLDQQDFLSDMFRRFPLIRRDGKFSAKEEIRIYTQQFPDASRMLLKHSSLNSAKLLSNYLIAEKIPDEIHKNYWQEYFFSSRPRQEYLFYHYFLYPDATEVSFENDADTLTILDFWASDQLYLFRGKLSKEVRSCLIKRELNEIPDLLSQINSVIEIQGDHWRNQLDSVLNSQE